MSTTPNQPQGGEPAGEPAESPLAFDKEAARQRYRATMRGPFMRLNYVLLALIILAAWGFGVAAVLAKDVEQLPGHDITVAPSRCVACHTARTDNAPALPHPAFPSCGFCHRQGAPNP